MIGVVNVACWTGEMKIKTESTVFDGSKELLSWMDLLVKSVYEVFRARSVVSAYD